MVMIPLLAGALVSADAEIAERAGNAGDIWLTINDQGEDVLKVNLSYCPDWGNAGESGTCIQYATQEFEFVLDGSPKMDYIVSYLLDKVGDPALAVQYETTTGKAVGVKIQ